MSRHESDLAQQMRFAKIPYTAQFRAIPGRRYRYDFLIGEDPKCADLLVEVQGGIFMAKSAHNTGTGITRDMTKLNLAVLNGYRVLQVSPEHIKSGQAIQWIREAVGMAA